MHTSEKKRPNLDFYIDQSISIQSAKCKLVIHLTAPSHLSTFLYAFNEKQTVSISLILSMMPHSSKSP